MTIIETLPARTWQQDLYQLLRDHGITQFAFVPDAGHRHLIDTALEDPEVHAIPLSTEEEGVGVVAGAYLGGERGVLLMQSSGVGNTINFLSLIQHCQIPFLTIVTMRGDYGEQNPWQFAMGRAVEPTLQAMDVITLRTDSPEDVTQTVEAALGSVHRAGRSVAVLLTQRLLGAKSF
ncbi:thiamine pyrophosphate-binding protein [Paenarthrobacter sp. YAF11_1]|uniref:thiamine pyrophosphate-binding protein n=1 Tax=Paenarthrobacter sp. YAF11_1 TaxID=3233074 RepID=UPI003F9AEA03